MFADKFEGEFFVSLWEFLLDFIFWF